MRALFLLLLVACGPGSSGGLVEQYPVEVRTAVDGKPSARGGRFELVLEHDADIEVEWPEIEGTRLEITQDGDVREEQVGDRVVRTGRYTFTGDKGSHVVPAVLVRFEDDGVPGFATSQPLYVDMGVEAPRAGELIDIAEPPSMFRIPWWLVGTLFGILALFAVGLSVAFRKGGARELAAVPPEPPDVIALRAWEAIRAAEDLSDYDKALGISRIYREYAETVLSFKATALTTTEILERLRHMVHLEDGNVPRSKRLLRATDRIKFAEVAIGKDLFDELDADLRAFVESTRPHHWVPEGAEVRVVQDGRAFDLPWWVMLGNRMIAGGSAVGAVMILYVMVTEFDGGLSLPRSVFLGTLILVSCMFVLAAVHAVLAKRSFARRLKWAQVLVAMLWLLFIPIGTVYGLIVLYVTLSSASGKAFYASEAT